MQSKHNEEEHKKIAFTIQNELKELLLHDTPTTNVHGELKMLDHYFAYKISLSFYNATMEAVVAKLELIRTTHLHDVLHKFDVVQKKHA